MFAVFRRPVVEVAPDSSMRIPMALS